MVRLGRAIRSQSAFSENGNMARRSRVAGLVTATQLKSGDGLIGTLTNPRTDCGRLLPRLIIKALGDGAGVEHCCARVGIVSNALNSRPTTQRRIAIAPLQFGSS